MISLTITIFLVLVVTVSNAESLSNSKIIPKDDFSEYHGNKLPELNYYKFYDELKPASQVVVVYPIFTQAAYDFNGFHYFYKGTCDECIQTKIPNYYEQSLTSSSNAFRIFEFLGYHTIDDIDIDQNPSILEKYDKVILLHNEFVTKQEFEAIISHPNVVYLYPNALSSEVKADYSNNSIMLIRGPGYPDSKITNAFDWKFDNTHFFSDWECNNWYFYNIDNGHMLNCYPETELPFFGKEIIATIKTL